MSLICLKISISIKSLVLDGLCVGISLSSFCLKNSVWICHLGLDVPTLEPCLSQDPSDKKTIY